MKSLNKDYLDSQPLSMELARLVHVLGEYKGKQELLTHQTPQILETLKEAAIIQSTESSNRIEGISVLPERLRELMIKKSEPKDRTEAEIIGYRNVLAQIHTRFDETELNPSTIQRLHSEMFKRTGMKGGQWKQKDNTIEEKLPTGQWVTRFIPVTAQNTPYFMIETCKNYDRLLREGKINPLLLIATFILDFLCIHPFTDGNGRISRLLTLLLLHKAGFEIGRYISLERIVEESKESYYESLQFSSQNWEHGKHNIGKWWECFLTTLLAAYQEFEERVGTIRPSRGSKTELILSALDHLPPSFRFSDVVRLCPTVGHDMVRVVLNRLRNEGKVECSRSGRGAIWKKVEK
ncbi:MAG: Fic family protein [Deltaproteobacteria bacterium]|nr:Fic family protein [Deltaproteobacteria bacterium]